MHEGFIKDFSLVTQLTFTYKKWCKICSKLTKKTPKRRQWRRFGVLIANFEHISPFSSVYIVDFEKVNASWEPILTYLLR